MQRRASVTICYSNGSDRPHRRRLFNRIRQVKPIGTASNTWFLGYTRDCASPPPQMTSRSVQLFCKAHPCDEQTVDRHTRTDHAATRVESENNGRYTDPCPMQFSSVQSVRYERGVNVLTLLTAVWQIPGMPDCQSNITMDVLGRSHSV